MKTEEQIKELMRKSIGGIIEILQPHKLRVPETDDIIDMLFCYFISNSVSSIPEDLRKEYLQYRLMGISEKVAYSLEQNNIKIECEDCKNETHEKETIH